MSQRKCLASRTRTLCCLRGAGKLHRAQPSAYGVASSQMQCLARSLRQCQVGAWCASSAAVAQPVGGRGRSRAGPAAVAEAAPAPAGSPAASGAAPGGRCQLCGVTCCWPGGGDPVVDPPAMGDGAPGEPCDRVIFICGVSARGRTEFYQARRLRLRFAEGQRVGGALLLAPAQLPAALRACKGVRACRGCSAGHALSGSGPEAAGTLHRKVMLQQRLGELHMRRLLLSRAAGGCALGGPARRRWPAAGDMLYV